MYRLMLALSATLLLAQTAAAQSTAWADKLFAGVTTHDFGIVPRARS